MATFRDTTKRDWGLVIAGVVSLSLFFLFYGDYHPLGVADSSLGEISASERAVEYFNDIGFSSDKDPNTEFRINQSLLDSLQAQTNFHQFYLDENNRSLYPVFYWESKFFIEPLPTRSINLGPNQAKVIDLRLNEYGRLIALLNNHDILPASFTDLNALSYAFDSTPIIPTETDSLMFQRLNFVFDDETDVNEFDEIDLSERHVFGKNIAEKIATYHLTVSGWNEDRFYLESSETVVFENIDAAKITFKAEEGFLRQIPNVEITVLPTGSLVSMEYSFLEDETEGVGVEEIVSNIRNAVTLFILFWILALLFIRFRMRLIDMKAAILIAVLAGFIYPFVTVMQMLNRHLNAFGEINTSFILSLFLVIGVVAAFTSVIYFIVTSIADSISRENWNEKLRTSDLIRTGHFVNRPVGLALIRGCSYAFILTGVWLLLFIISPDSYLSLNRSLFGSNHYLPNMAMILSNLAWYFIVAQVVFLIIISYIRNFTQSSFIIVLVVGLIFAGINPLGFSFDSLTTEILFVGIIGIITGFIYLNDDYLTVFITLFILTGLIDSSSGWLMENSPDSSIFLSYFIIIIGGMVFGAYSVFKGKSIQELPKYVPEYIEELAQEERIKQELQIARKVQESFLPVRTPNFPGLDIAAICKPAYETGGDYYDFIELENDRLAVAIGDVSGKGIQAAFFMTFTKGVLHAICDHFESTTEVLAKTNNLFRKNANRGTFISLIFGVVDLKSDLFRFSRAGHNPLLYYSSEEEKLFVYTPEGLGLGMAKEELFRKNITEQEINLKKDDLLIMFTDGVVEATNNMEEFYGDEKLQRLIAKYHHLGAEELLDKILEDVNKFGENSSQHDDMTMLVIKKR